MAGARPSHGRVQELGRRVLGWIAVGVDDEVLVAVVHRLQRCPRGGVDDAAGGHVDALRRLAEVHRQRAGEHDERLLLDRVPVPAAGRARLVAPDVPADVRGAEALAELRHVPGRLAWLVRPRDPLEVVGADDAKAHGAHTLKGRTTWDRRESPAGAGLSRRLYPRLSGRGAGAPRTRGVPA